MRSISGVVAPVSTGPARGPARASERDRTRSADHAALPPRVAPVAPLRSRHASGSRWLHPVRGLRPRPVANGRLERARLPLALASRDGLRAIRRLSRQADRLRRPAGRRPGGSRSQTEARRVSAPEAWSADGTTAGARRADGTTARHEKGPVARRGLSAKAGRRLAHHLLNFRGLALGLVPRIQMPAMHALLTKSGALPNQVIDRALELLYAIRELGR